MNDEKINEMMKKVAKIIFAENLSVKQLLEVGGSIFVGTIISTNTSKKDAWKAIGSIKIALRNYYKKGI